MEALADQYAFSDDALAALRCVPVVCRFIASCSNVFLPFLIGIMLSCLGLGAVLCLSIDFCRRYSEVIYSVTALRYLRLSGSQSRFSTHRALVLAVLALTLMQTAVGCASTVLLPRSTHTPAGSRIVKIFGDGFGDFVGFLETRPEDVASPLLGTVLQTQTQIYSLIKCVTPLNSQWMVRQLAQSMGALQSDLPRRMACLRAMHLGDLHRWQHRPRFRCRHRS